MEKEIRELYDYIENYAREHMLTDTFSALPYALEKHQGQFRKGEKREPYFIHPLTCARQAIALGLDQDAVVATALLHDVCEDCGVMPQELPVSAAVQDAVDRLTKKKEIYGAGEEGKAAYFDGIADNPIALLVKLLDRCHNVSQMAHGFSAEKIMSYAGETRVWFEPLFSIAENRYPEYGQQLFLLQYQIRSLTDACTALAEKCELP